MPRRSRSNLGRCTRRAEALRRVIANQTEEERASANEQNKRAARLEDARFPARRSRSPASDLHSQKNKRDPLRMAERRQRETADQRQAQLRAQQSQKKKFLKMTKAKRRKYSHEEGSDWVWNN